MIKKIQLLPLQVYTKNANLTHLSIQLCEEIL